jgi:hypothetical protein
MLNSGLGVLLSQLSYQSELPEVENLLKSVIGKKIKSVQVVNGNDEHFLIEMKKGISFRISDEGQSCCENRYLVCDDVLNQYSGARLLGIEVRDWANKECEYGEHEIQFVVIQTDLGNITLETHNEHNGYYGGFSICIREIK